MHLNAGTTGRRRTASWRRRGRRPRAAGRRRTTTGTRRKGLRRKNAADWPQHLGGALPVSQKSVRTVSRERSTDRSRSVCSIFRPAPRDANHRPGRARGRGEGTAAGCRPALLGGGRRGAACPLPPPPPRWHYNAPPGRRSMGSLTSNREGARGVVPELLG